MVELLLDHLRMLEQVLKTVEYSKFFNELDSLPARSCVAVKELPMGANFEIEAIFFKSHGN